MAEWIANSESALHKMIGDLRAMWQQHKYLKVKAQAGKKRSLDQNDISHVWYHQLALELREDDARGWKRFCKLHFGVPILRAEDSDFRAFYDAAVKDLEYEQKLQAMDFVPVTSIMTKPQLSSYLETMREHFRKNHAVSLEFPEAPR